MINFIHPNDFPVWDESFRKYDDQVPGQFLDANERCIIFNSKEIDDVSVEYKDFVNEK